jgi:hypothetical protein
VSRYRISLQEIRDTARFVREQVEELEPFIEAVGALEPSQWPRRGTVRDEIGLELWTLAIRVASADKALSRAEMDAMFELFAGLFDYPWTDAAGGHDAAIAHMQAGAYRDGSQFDVDAPWMSRLDLVLAESDRRTGGRLARDYGRVLFAVARLIARADKEITPSEAGEIVNHIAALRRLAEATPRATRAQSAEELLAWLEGLLQPADGPGS